MLRVLGDVLVAPPVSCRTRGIVPLCDQLSSFPERFFWEQACPKPHFSGGLCACGTVLSAVAPAKSRLATPMLNK